MARPVVVIGSSNVDFIMKMERLPARDETVTDATFMQAFGGKGANQAVAAGRAGGDVTFVSCMGDDLYAERMVANLQESGVHTEHVYRETGVASGAALIMVGEGGHNYIAVAPGANRRLTPGYIEKAREAIAQAAYVLLQFEIPLETVERAIEIAHEAGTAVVWNYAPAKPFDLSLLQRISIVVANEPESTLLTGVTVADLASAREAARRLREMGSETAIITLGEAGSLVATAEAPDGLHVPAFPVTAVDTTAAGDTYCGCLVTALAEGRPLPEAVRFASAAAALCVQRMGAQPSIPWREEIEAFLAQRV